MLPVTQSSTPGIIDIVYKEVTKLVGKKIYYRYSYHIFGGLTALIISIVLILYTIDVAIRALKLAILRLIAPIPIISHMSISAKEGKGEDAFSCWIRSLTSTYLELFIRLAIMYFAVYLVNDIISNGMFINTGTGFVGVLSFIFIVIGIFIFAAGVVVSAFIPLIFKNTPFSLGLIYFGFYAILSSAVCTYLINYRQIILSADQKNYVVTAYLQTAGIVKTLIQMGVVY